MTKSRRELKQAARELLVGKYGVAIAAFVLVAFVSILFSWLFSIISPIGLSRTILTASLPAIIITAAAYLIIALLNSILTSGVYAFYLNIARGKEFNITDIFYGFTHQPDKVILVQLRILLICLPCIVPYVLLVVLITYVFGENTVPFIVLSLLAVIAFACIFLMILLRYELVFYLKADHPEYSVPELTRESRRLMTGHRFSFFKLGLSFLGLLILSLLSLGIGLLWIQPYIRMTETLFYLNLTEGDQLPG